MLKHFPAHFLEKFYGKEILTLQIFASVTVM
jgi:hypothetical protein